MPKASKRKSSRIAFQLPADLDNFLTKRAAQLLCSKSALIRRILDDYWESVSP